MAENDAFNYKKKKKRLLKMPLTFYFIYFLIIVKTHFDFPLGNLATQDDCDVSSSKC